MGTLRPQTDSPLLRVLRRPFPALQTLWIVLGETTYHPTGIDPLRPCWERERARADVRIKQGQRIGPFWYGLAFLFPPLRWLLERSVYLAVDIQAGRLPEAVVERMCCLLGAPWPRGRMLRWFRNELRRRGEP